MDLCVVENWDGSPRLFKDTEPLFMLHNDILVDIDKLWQHSALVVTSPTVGVGVNTYCYFSWLIEILITQTLHFLTRHRETRFRTPAALIGLCDFPPFLGLRHAECLLHQLLQEQRFCARKTATKQCRPLLLSPLRPRLCAFLCSTRFLFTRKLFKGWRLLARLSTAPPPGLWFLDPQTTPARLVSCNNRFVALQHVD